MAKAVEMPCNLKALRHIEATENLHPGSLVEPGMVHGNLAWSKEVVPDFIRLVVTDEFGEIVYTVGAKLPVDWVAYFSMETGPVERMMNLTDFRGVLNMLREMK
jgi:hypothetical protein